MSNGVGPSQAGSAWSRTTPGGSGPTRATSAGPSLRRDWESRDCPDREVFAQSPLPAPAPPPEVPSLAAVAVGAPRRLAAGHRRWRRCKPPLLLPSSSLFLFSSLSSFCARSRSVKQPSIKQALKGVKATAKVAKGAIKGYFFNPRFQYKDNVHNDGEVMRGTMNVITRLARTMNERLDAMAEVERYRMKLGIYGGYDMRCAAQRLTPGYF
ncbi:hypothetical protein Taro_022017, partial [Colocasia esculenta]|nr:hypothetical protein [Colocasia esculenta]